MKLKSTSLILMICFVINYSLAKPFNVETYIHRTLILKNDSVAYTSLLAWVSTKFHETNRYEYFDALCLEDCISFTFNINDSGELTIKEFSKFIPQKVKQFLEKSIVDLNGKTLSQKPFVQEWLKNKFANKLIMQPILIAFFTNKCKPNNVSSRGFLSLLTTESDSGAFGSGQGMMTIMGDFNVKPFEGIMLTPFMLKSPMR